MEVDHDEGCRRATFTSKSQYECPNKNPNTLEKTGTFFTHRSHATCQLGNYLYVEVRGLHASLRNSDPYLELREENERCLW